MAKIKVTTKIKATTKTQVKVRIRHNLSVGFWAQILEGSSNNPR